MSNALVKVTVNLPRADLETAVELSGKGVTTVLRSALKGYIQKIACEQLIGLKGKVKFTKSAVELRG